MPNKPKKPTNKRVAQLRAELTDEFSSVVNEEIIKFIIDKLAYITALVELKDE